MSHDGSRALIWAQYSSGSKRCYALVDFDRPDRGRVIRYFETGMPGENLPVWNPIHSSDAHEWLVQGEHWQVLKEDGTRVAQIPATNALGAKWSAVIWSSKRKTAFSIVEGTDGKPSQLAETMFSEGRAVTKMFNLDLPNPRLTRAGKLVLLHSGRLLLEATERSADPKNFGVRHHLMLSDTTRRKWRRVGGHVLRGASWNGKHVLLGGPRLTDRHWVVQITEQARACRSLGGQGCHDIQSRTSRTSPFPSE